MKRPIIIILSVVAVFVLLGTMFNGMFATSYGYSEVAAPFPGYGSGGGSAPVEVASYDAFAPVSVEESKVFAVDVANSVQPQAPQQERLVIKNADLAVVVADPKKSMQEIADLATELGGFVVSSNLYTTYYGPNSIEAPEASVVIRVPAEKLNQVLSTIKKDAVDVEYENTNSSDITSQYVDLQSQLSAKQAAEKKLLEFMNQAEKTEDVLAVYTQLQIIQSEIEVLKGQIKYYDESVALSSVSIRLIAEETVQPVEVGGWKLDGAANDAVQSLINFTQGFTRFLIQLVLFILPALIIIAIPAYGVFLGGRALVRRFGKVEKKEEEKK